MHDNAWNIYVNAGHVVIFADGVGNAFKDDVLSSSLYLQLAATKKYSRFDDFNAWCSLYTEAMPRFGWVTMSQRSIRNAAEGEISFAVWNHISSRLGDKANRLLMDKAVDEEVSAGLLLFRDHAVNVQTKTTDKHAIVEEASLSLVFSFVSSEHVITSVFLAFKTSEFVEKNMFSQVFQTEKLIGDLGVEILTAKINEHHYRRVRDRLNAELGPRKKELIIGLNGGRPIHKLTARIDF